MAGLGRGSNPCSVLNSYHQGCRYELRGESGPPHAKEFMMAVTLPGLEREYVGVGKSKKLAKHSAAATALLDMYDIRLQLGDSEPLAPVPLAPPGEHEAARPCTPINALHTLCS